MGEKWSLEGGGECQRRWWVGVEGAVFTYKHSGKASFQCHLHRLKTPGLCRWLGEECSGRGDGECKGPEVCSWQVGSTRRRPGWLRWNQGYQGWGQSFPQSPEPGGARRPARGLHTDQMSTGGEGTALGAFGSPQQQDWPRELIVGVRVRVTDAARISVLRSWKGEAAPGGGWPRSGFGGPLPTVSQLSWQLASHRHLASWGNSRPPQADGTAENRDSECIPCLRSRLT